MVIGFYCLDFSQKKPSVLDDIIEAIETLNAAEDFGFYENFNTKTGAATGVKLCTWSAAGQILATQYSNGKTLLK